MTRSFQRVLGGARRVISRLRRRHRYRWRPAGEVDDGNALFVSLQAGRNLNGVAAFPPQTDHGTADLARSHQANFLRRMIATDRRGSAGGKRLSRQRRLDGGVRPYPAVKPSRQDSSMHNLRRTPFLALWTPERWL